MTDQQQHPITPPRELVSQWRSEPEYGTPGRVTLHTISEQRLFQLLTRAAKWGYDQRGEVNEAKLQQARDQELEACNNWLVLNGYGDAASRLRAARRPKPPSAVEQAEELIDSHEDGWCPNPSEWNIIREGLAEGRRALEDSND